jgi:hypothetical protein
LRSQIEISDDNGIRGTARIVSEVNSGARQVIIFPQQLLVVEPLNRFIIDPAIV